MDLAAMAQNVTLLRRSPQLEPGSWWWPAGATAPVASCAECWCLVALSGKGIVHEGRYVPRIRCRGCNGVAVVRLMGWGKP